MPTVIRCRTLVGDFGLTVEGTIEEARAQIVKELDEEKFAEFINAETGGTTMVRQEHIIAIRLDEKGKELRPAHAPFVSDEMLPIMVSALDRFSAAIESGATIDPAACADLRRSYEILVDAYSVAIGDEKAAE